MFNALALLGPSLKLLHLRPIYSLEEFKSLSALTSLEVHASLLSLKDPLFPFDKHQTNRDMLYALFCIPTLKSLAVMGLVSWDIFRPRREDQDNRAKTSSVIHLSLPATVLSGPDLAEVLPWPKALQSLRIEEFSYDFFAHLEQLPFGGYHNMTTLSGAEIVDALQSQRDNLEEFSLSGRLRNDVYDDIPTPGINLTTFHNSGALGSPGSL